MTEYFSRYARDYDRMQPVVIEMYRFYHELALDIVPFEADQAFRFADLGCGTGTFTAMLVDRFSNAKGIALDLHSEMLQVAEEKAGSWSDRIDFRAHDLSDPLPDSLAELDLAVSFSALHHLLDARKRTVVGEIFNALKPGGWLILMDAMYVPYANGVWSRGLAREKMRRSERFIEYGISGSEHGSHERAKLSLDQDSPERDRISTLDEQIENLRNAGFSSVNHVWHLWMEHLIVAVK